MPAWLASRMEALGTAISEAVLLHHGRDGLLARLSDPFWFQALGCVMGMDWHSSGITTSVMSALKRGLNPRAFDGRGNYTLGVREQLIFPEIDYDSIDEVRGLDVAITTTAETDERRWDSSPKWRTCA